MGRLLKPQIESREVSSQATPFAQDFLSFLQNQLGQAESGGGLFGGGNVRDVASPDNLITGLTDVHRREVGRSSADLNEAFGTQGARFGSTVGRAQTDLHRESNQDLATIMADLELNLNKLGIDRDLAVGNQRLAATEIMGRTAGQGIIPDQTIVSDSPFVQIMKIFTDLAKAAGPMKGMPTG